MYTLHLWKNINDVRFMSNVLHLLAGVRHHLLCNEGNLCSIDIVYIYWIYRGNYVLMRVSVKTIITITYDRGSQTTH